MANLLTYRGGKYERQAPRPVEPISPRLSQAGGVARAEQQLGGTLAGIGTDIANKAIAKTLARRSAAESTDFEVKKLQLFTDFQHKVADEGITDDMPGEFDKFSKQRHKDLFGGFTVPEARQKAQNDWALTSQLKKSQFAIEGIKRDIDEKDAMGLRAIDQFMDWPEAPKDQFEVAERVDAATKTIERLKASGSPAFQSEAKNQQMIEDVTKAGMRPYLMNEAKTDPLILNEVNKQVDYLFNGDVPNGAYFTDEDIQKMKDEDRARALQNKADVKKQKAERLQAVTESLVTMENLQRGVIDFEQVLLDTPGLTTEETLKIKQVYMNYKRVMEDTGEEYLNQRLLYEVVKDVQDAKMTVPDLEELWLKDDTLQWPVSTQIQLRSQIRSQEASRSGTTTGGFKVSDPGVKQLLERWDLRFEDKEGGKTVIPTEDYKTWNEGRMGLIKALEAAYPDSGAMLKAYEDYLKTVDDGGGLDKFLKWFLLDSPVTGSIGGGGLYTGLSLLTHPVPAPKTRKEFEENVIKIGRRNEDAAKSYFDKYDGKL